MGYYSDIDAGRSNPGSAARRKARDRQREQKRAERERAERKAQAAEVEEQGEPETQGEPEEQHEPESVTEQEAFWKRLEPGWWEPHFASGEEAVRALNERGWTKEEGHGYKVAVNRYHTRQREERQEQ